MNGRTATGSRKRKLVGINSRTTGVKRQLFGSLLISRSFPKARSVLEKNILGICISPELPMMYYSFSFSRVSNRNTNFYSCYVFLYRVVCVSILFFILKIFILT